MNVHPHREGSRNERGIALISALLILVLLAIAGATFMQTTSGERAVASNVNTARASLLAADGGVRISQQVLANMGKAKLDSLLTLWNGVATTPIIPSPGLLFPAGNLPSVAYTNPNVTAIASIAWADTDITPTSQAYDFLYTVTATGTAGASGQRQVMSTGMLRVSATRGSFSDYLMYTNHHTTGGGASIWFTSSSQFDGRVHTNEEFRFAFQPGFQDKVTSVDNNAWFYNNNSPIERAASANGTIDVPDFFGGFQRNAANVPLPTDSYNQQSAAAGYSPTAGVAPTNLQLRTKFGLSAGTSAPPNGVYVPNASGSVVGGIYVQGNLDQLKAVADTVNHRQVYYLKQGSTTTTVTINRAANSGTGSTTVQVGAATPTVYSSVPRGVTFVNGTVADLRGPDRSGGNVVPAIEHSEKMLFAATGDITLQRDLTCEDYSSNGDNVAGIFSSGGDVVIGTTAPDDMNLDAFVMAAGSNGEFRVDNYNSGSPRGTFHMRGGCVEQYYGAFFTFNTSGVLQTGYARDWHYDRRGIKPPYFPETASFDPDAPSARTLSWKEI